MMRRLREWLAPEHAPASKYLAGPPAPLLALGWRPLLAVPCRLARSLLFLVCHTVSPYSAGPTEPRQKPPEAQGGLSADQLEQCKRIYDEVDATRAVLEDKAKSVFSLITFVVPVSVATAVYILDRAPLDRTQKGWAITSLALAALLLSLAFTAASRAVFVRQRSQLFLASVIDEERNRFREFDPGFYARGLLWCASMNAATNGHVGEFVKATQVFTALAVICLAAAAVPVGLSILHPPEELSAVGKTRVVRNEVIEEMNRGARQRRDVLHRLSLIEAAAVTTQSRIAELEFEMKEQASSIERMTCTPQETECCASDTQRKTSR